MSAADPSTSWKNMSTATRAFVVGGLTLAAGLIVWLNFIR